MLGGEGAHLLAPGGCLLHVAALGTAAARVPEQKNEPEPQAAGTLEFTHLSPADPPQYRYVTVSPLVRGRQLTTVYSE